MEKMISANKDPNILIKESDQEFIHVKLTKRTVIPGKEQYPRIDYEVKCYKPDVFKKLEALRYAAQPIIWYRAGGFSEAIVVHDPELWAKQRLEKEEAEKKAEEDRRIKEIADLEKRDKEAADKKRKEFEAKEKEKKRIAAELKEKEEAEKKAAEQAKKNVKSEIRKTGKRNSARAVKKGQGTA